MTLEEAEEFYKSYGCSSFHMARDDLELYAQYMALNIDEKQEREWQLESFYKICENLLAPETPQSEISLLHSSALNYLESFRRSKKLFKQLVKNAESALDRVPANEAIMCAEDILGRRAVSSRDSIIFVAANLKEEGDMHRLLEIVSLLIERSAGYDNERVERAMARKAEIIGMLGL